MNTKSGVGWSDLAFHKSSTFRACGPYETLARSGDGLSSPFFLARWASKLAESETSSNSAAAAIIGR